MSWVLRRVGSLHTPLVVLCLQILWGTLLLRLKSGSRFVNVLCLVCNLPQLLTYAVIFSLLQFLCILLLKKWRRHLSRCKFSGKSFQVPSPRSQPIRNNDKVQKYKILIEESGCSTACFYSSKLGLLIHRVFWEYLCFISFSLEFVFLL